MRTALLSLLLATGLHAQTVVDYPVAYPNYTQGKSACGHNGSTHEITADANSLWITGQNYDSVVHVALDGSMKFIAMPQHSGPHGIEFDGSGRLWVTLEFSGKIVRLDANGKIDKEIDVRLECPTCPDRKLGTHPHGMGFGIDGKTIWFTGKSTGTIGKINPDGSIVTYPLATVGSVPIYVKAAPDGSMWVTELVGNAIARITPDGKVTEFPIPTHNSRPIAIVPAPDGKSMWFSEEAGNKVARIMMDGTITEFAVPKTQDNVILAGLSFDSDGNLWTQQYVDQNSPTPANPSPAGTDYLVRIDKAIAGAASSDISRIPIRFFEVPTCATVMHRIIEGPDGQMWFTELGANKVGKVTKR